MTTHLAKSRTFPVGVDDAYDRVLVAPLPEIFSRRFLVISPITSVEGQDGVWGTSVGQTRTIKLSDGGTVLETLTEIERPHHFAYSIINVTGMLKPLVVAASGKWTFEPVGTGVRITWAWDVTPTDTLGRYAMPLFGRLWSGYARQALDQIEPILLGSATAA
ncbi:MAG: hypothetical protein RJA49_359 [Actinomycetota bacterium]